MRLSIMPLLTVYSSQSTAIPITRFLGHAFFWYHVLRGCTALSKHQDPV